MFETMKTLVFDKSLITKYKKNILQDRDKWAMEEKIKEVDLYLQQLLKGEL
jgi:hypothetical protein